MVNIKYMKMVMIGVFLAGFYGCAAPFGADKEAEKYEAKISQDQFVTGLTSRRYEVVERFRNYLSQHNGSSYIFFVRASDNEDYVSGIESFFPHRSELPADLASQLLINVNDNELYPFAFTNKSPVCVLNEKHPKPPRFPGLILTTNISGYVEGFNVSATTFENFFIRNTDKLNFDVVSQLQFSRFIVRVGLRDCRTNELSPAVISEVVFAKGSSNTGAMVVRPWGGGVLKNMSTRGRTAAEVVENAIFETLLVQLFKIYDVPHSAQRYIINGGVNPSIEAKIIDDQLNISFYGRRVPAKYQLLVRYYSRGAVKHQVERWVDARSDLRSINVEVDNVHLPLIKQIDIELHIDDQFSGAAYTLNL